MEVWRPRSWFRLRCHANVCIACQVRLCTHVCPLCRRPFTQVATIYTRYYIALSTFIDAYQQYSDSWDEVFVPGEYV
jgi:hypothetical protein